MRFKEFLNESSIQFITDAAKIEDYLSARYNNGDYDITSDAKGFGVHMRTDIDIEHLGLIQGHLPFRIIKMEGLFDASKSHIKTLEGLPAECWQQFDISDCKSLASLKGAPKILHDNLIITNSGINSLVGVSDIFKMIDGVFIFDSSQITEGGLGLVLVDAVYVMDRGPKHTKNAEAFKIIHAHAGKPDQLFDCQQELIEAGYEEYAQL